MTIGMCISQARSFVWHFFFVNISINFNNYLNVSLQISLKTKNYIRINPPESCTKTKINWKELCIKTPRNTMIVNYRMRIRAKFVCFAHIFAGAVCSFSKRWRICTKFESKILF